MLSRVKGKSNFRFFAVGNPEGSPWSMLPTKAEMVYAKGSVYDVNNGKL